MGPIVQGAAHRLLVADELGLLKAVEVPAGPNWEGSSVVQRWGEPDRSKAVQALCFSATSLEQGTDALVAAGRAGCTVSIMDAATGANRGSCKASTSGRPADDLAVRGLAFLTAHASNDRQPDLLSLNSAGELLLHTAPEDPHAASGWTPRSSFTTVSNALCMALDGAQRTVAIGGEGCNLSLWDLSSQQQSWQAKGPKPNKVGLVDKPLVTAAAFLEGSGERQRVLVGTGAHKLLLYDPGAGRRPQLEVSWGETRITALAAEAQGAQVWAASGSGGIAALDLRKSAMQGSLKGAAGSVRALALHPTEPLLASVGLDRHLRVHSTSSRAPLARVYLKQQLTGVVWLPTVTLPEAVPGADAAAGDEDTPGAAGNAHVGQPAPGSKRKNSKRDVKSKRRKS